MPYIGNVTTSSNVNGSQINNGTITGDKLSLPFDYDSATLYLDNTNNRVGILTASPSSTLTVGTGGVVSIPLASAATPSLVFGTDTNTGIYSPGADQLAISTNSSQRLVIDSSGRVGIGASPSYTLHVAGPIASQSLVPALLLNDSTPTLGVSFGFYNGGVYYPYGVVALRDTTNNQTAYSYTAGASGYHNWFTNGTERLRITSTGNVGIGTTSPGAALDVVGELYAGNGTITNYLTYSVGNSTGIVGTKTNHSFEIRTNNVERCRVDTLGRLLVGTSTSVNPNTRAVFQGYSTSTDEYAIVCLKRGNDPVANGSGLGLLSFGDKDADNVASIGAYRDAGTWTHDSSEPTRLVFSTTADGAASPTERLRITSAGLVGVGTSSPGTKLEVAGSAAFRTDADVRLTIGSSGSIGSNNSNFIRAATDQVIYNAATSSGRHSWELAGSEKARIDSSGRLGIGTSSPSSYSTYADDLVISNGFAGITLASATSGYGSIYFADGTAGTDVQRGAIQYSHADDYLRFSTAVNERMRIDSSGRVGIGSTTFAATSKLQVFSDAGGRSVFRHASGDGGVTIAGAQAASSSSLIFGNTWDTENGANFVEEYRLFFDGSTDSLAFKYNNNVAEAMRLDSSGRLLVGTSSTSATTGLLVQGAGGAAPGIIRACYTTATPANGDTFGYLVFGDSTHADAAWVAASRDGGTWSGSSKPTRLVFSVTRDGQASPEERMRISQGGNIRMFAAAGNGGLALALTDNSASGQDGITLAHSATGIAGSGTVSFRVIANGNVTNTNNSYGAISDAKLKENIVDATSQWNDLKALQVRKYNFKEGQDPHPDRSCRSRRLNSFPLALSTNPPTATKKATTLAPSPKASTIRCST
jgi:hypothetical protein